MSIEDLINELLNEKRNLSFPLYNRPVLPFKPCKIMNLDGSGKKIVIDIFDYVDSFGVNSDYISNLLNQYDSIDEITVRINSPGGDPFTGIAIYQLLKDTGAKVKTIAMPLAASAAAIVFAAGNERLVYETSFIMIHNVSTSVSGTVEDLEEYADVMKKMNNAISILFSSVTGGTKEHIAKMMKKTTWMDSQQAVTEKMATGVIKSISPEEEELFNRLSNVAWDFHLYNNTPKELIKDQTLEQLGVVDKQSAERYLMRNHMMSRSSAKGLVNVLSDSLGRQEAANSTEIYDSLKSLLNEMKQVGAR